MPSRLITPPASEPVTLAEALEHLRLDLALDDATVNALITTARQYIEQVCWRGLVTQTWDLVLGSFAGEDTLELGTRSGRHAAGFGFSALPVGDGFLPWIELPKGNLGTVTSVKYYDPTGLDVTLASTEYAVDAADVPGRIYLAPGKSWPQTQSPRWDAVRIQYTVGWAVTSTVWAGPAPLKQALLLLLSQLYENRSPEVIGTIVSPISFTLDALLGPYRLNRL